MPVSNNIITNDFIRIALFDTMLQSVFHKIETKQQQYNKNHNTKTVGHKNKSIKTINYLNNKTKTHTQTYEADKLIGHLIFFLAFLLNSSIVGSPTNKCSPED